MDFESSPWDDAPSSSSNNVDKFDNPYNESHEEDHGAEHAEADVHGETEKPETSYATAPETATAPVAAEEVMSSSTIGSPSRPRGGAGRRALKKKPVMEAIKVEDSSSNPLGPLASSEATATQEGASTDDNDSHPNGAADEFADLKLNDETPQTSAELSSPEKAPSGNSPKHEKESQYSFKVSVGDPIKVGDIATAHTVYTVTTETNHPDFANKEVSVTRRYRDFRWIYHALEDNNPGIIVPPPPEKQAVGRFKEDFVESRRAALETMLNKIARHPVLSEDKDFHQFLESDTFTKVHSVDTEPPASSSGGFMSSLGGALSFSARFVETSEWFAEKKSYVDTLEAQFKSMAKALDTVIAQRKELSEATGEMASTLESLSDVVLSKSLASLLHGFSNAQIQIRDLYARQCLQDIMSMSNTLDEYLRLIHSIRSVFSHRHKAYFTAQNAEADLTKKRQHYDKLLRQGKTQQDKIQQLQAEVAEHEKRVVDTRVAFDDISMQIMSEFERFENSRVKDFRNSVELFLENAAEAQKEAIEVWETFYQMEVVAR